LDAVPTASSEIVSNGTGRRELNWMSSVGCEAVGQRGKRILIVDDEQIILDLLERVLSREGYEVSTACLPEEAIRGIRSGRYDLTIADAGLWRSDGRELLGLVNEANSETAIVLMTGYPEEGIVRFARDHADGFLEKPFALERFLAVVRRALATGQEAVHEREIRRPRSSPVQVRLQPGEVA
jgi:DNA-binding NtrC family response regulator